MAKLFSPEFKQQTIEYTLENSHEPIAAIVRNLGVAYSTLDKWVHETNITSKRILSPSNSVLLSLKRKLTNSRKPTTF